MKITSIIIVILIVFGVLFFGKGSRNAPVETAQKEGVIKTMDIEGMKVEVLQEGAGESVEVGNMPSMHYVGTLPDGTVFDSSVARGTPFSFTLGVGQVIRGWDLGVLAMKVGEKRRLTIPPELAYGDQGVQGVIPPKSTLIFEVELLDIKK